MKPNEFIFISFPLICNPNILWLFFDSFDNKRQSSYGKLLCDISKWTKGLSLFEKYSPNSFAKFDAFLWGIINLGIIFIFDFLLTFSFELFVDFDLFSSFETNGFFWKLNFNSEKHLFNSKFWKILFGFGFRFAISSNNISWVNPFPIWFHDKSKNFNWDKFFILFIIKAPELFPKLLYLKINTFKFSEFDNKLDKDSIELSEIKFLPKFKYIMFNFLFL